MTTIRRDGADALLTPAPPSPDEAPTSNASHAYAVLKRRIVDNFYAPSATVPVQEVSAELGMSRTPIRDALIRLEKERLVELVPRYGFRVLGMSAQGMLDIYQILAGLEAVAIELIIERGPTASEMARLGAAADGLAAALEEGDLDLWAEADAVFHTALAEVSGNRQLVATVRQFAEQTSRARAVTLRLRPAPTTSTQNHRRLVEAIAAGDAVAAREIHWNQRLRSGRELADILRRLNMRHL
ncbi:GntR family transcriptional regulator [Acuticoccus sp.]|uniref:GntR family transcriptional regulator n=1 Tax=Acuticoccus sp. TaxID=1904378 RepID=UPI003B525DC7